MSVKKWENERLYIIIAIESWEEITRQLEKENLMFAKDYNPYSVYVKLLYTATVRQLL